MPCEFIQIGKKTINLGSVRYVEDLTGADGVPACMVYSEAGQDKLTGDQAKELLAFVDAGVVHPLKKDKSLLDYVHPEKDTLAKKPAETGK